jgi:tetratricopeptide (TPR) repeat protein
LVPYYTEGSRSYDLLGFWNILEKQEEAKVDPNIEKKKLWNIDVVGAYESALVEHPDMLDAEKECRLRYALGLFFRNAGWHEGAATSERRALDLCETLPEDTDDIFNLKLDISLELSKAYLDRGDLKNASEILVKALQVLGDDVVSNENNENSHQNFDLRHINIRNEYARVLKDQGKYADAESVSKITLKAATERFGMAHFATQNEMRWLAEIMRLEGKFAEAELLYRSVLKNVEASLGSESLDVAYYLNEFATFLRIKGLRREISPQTGIRPVAGGDYEEAQQLFERAITIIEKRLGKKHPDLGQLLDNFAVLHTNNSNWEKAEPLFIRSLAINEVAYGPEHPTIALGLNNYAVQLYLLGKYDEAEIPYRRALEIRRKALSENHPETAVSYNNLANLLRRQGKFDEAQECYAQTLRIRLATIGPMHVDTSRTLEGYGRFMRIKGDFVAAEDLLNRSHAAKKHSLGIEHHDTIFMGLAVAEVLLEQSKDESARNIVNEVIRSIDMNEAAAIVNEVIEILGTEYAIKEELRKKLEHLVKPI